MNTGGLCFSDSNQTVRAALRGLFEEFHQRIEDDYTQRGVALPYRVAVKDNAHWTYEPHVAFRHPILDRKFKVASDAQVFTDDEIERLIGDYVRAARALGQSNLRIMVRHILPNSLTPVVTLVPFEMAAAIDCGVK